MTVFCCRDGIVAADTAAWHGDIRLTTARKVRRLSDGRIFTGYGDKSLIDACAAWLSGEREKPDAAVNQGDFGGLVLSTTGVSWVDHRFDLMECSDAPFHAGGAHEEFLYGAMAAGASAEEAVGLAIRYCRDAGGTVLIERLE